MDAIRYIFRDASVAPRFHRSYDILVNSSVSICTVTSYEDLIVEKTYPVAKGYFDNLVKLSQKLQQGGGEYSRASGTKRFKIVLERNSKVIYELIWDSYDEAHIQASTWAYIEAIENTIPDLKALIQVD